MATPCNPRCNPSGGNCVNAVCVCNSNYRGPTCSIAITSAAYTTATGSGLASNIAGVAGTFQINAFTVFAQPQTAGGDPFFVTILQGTSTVASVTPVDNNNGVYTVNYSPLTIAATYTVSILFGSTPISGSPYTLVVSASSISAANSRPVNYTTLAGNWTAGSDSFWVEARDSFNNRVLTGVTAGFTATAGTSSGSFAWNAAAGLYALTFTLTTASTVSASIKFSGIDISLSPFSVTVNPGPLSALSFISSTGFNVSVAGTPVTISVLARDQYGNPRTRGLDTFLTTWLGPTNLNIFDPYNFPSTWFSADEYRIVYRLNISGDWVLNLRIPSSPPVDVIGSPISGRVTPAAVSAARCTVSGTFSNFTAGSSMSGWSITSRDAYNNVRTTGTDTFVIALTGAATVSGSAVWSASTSTYACSYTTNVAGTYSMSITIGGLHISGSPFTVFVLPAAFALASTLVSAPTSVAAGSNAVFYAVARDQFNNVVAFPGTPAPSAAASSPMSVVSSVRATLSTWNVTTTATLAGTYTVSLSQGGNLPGSPYTLTVVPAAIAASTTVASGAGLQTHPNSVAGTFIVQPRDIYGNNVLTNTASLSVTVVGPSTLTANIAYNAAGFYNVTYPGGPVGSYTVSVFQGGVAIQTPPAVISLLGVPTITTVVPALGSAAGGTLVSLSGSNFAAGVTYCRFASASVLATVISPTAATCVAPAYSLAPLTVSSAVSLTATTDGSTYSAAVTFTYYVPTSAYAVSPATSVSWGGDLVTVTAVADSFVNTPALSCQFGTTTVAATFVNVRTITCLSPSLSTVGLTPFAVSNNAVDFVPWTSQFFYTEPFSSLCRTLDELDISKSDRIASGYPYFDNLARTAGNASDSDSGSANATVKAQIVDGDRCCARTTANGGYQCGLLFAPRNSPLARSVVKLPRRAFITELVSSWYNPCVDMPRSYTIEYGDGAGGWTAYQTRNINDPNVAGQQRPCYTLPSDQGTVGLCFEFFAPILTDSFRLSWNNSVARLPSSSLGAWLFEFELHGIYENDAFSIQQTGALAASYRTAVSVAIPALTVSTRNLVGTVLGALDVSAHNISYQLWTLDGSDQPLTDVSARYLRGTTAQTIAAGTGSIVFSSMTLDRIPPGRYGLQPVSGSLQTTTLAFDILIGDPVALRISAPVSQQLEVDSLATTALGNIQIQALDASGTFIGSAQQSSVSVDVSLALATNSTTLQGVLSAPLQNGLLSFSTLALQAPPQDTYFLQFVPSSPAIAVAYMLVSVVPGPPVALVVTTPSSQTLSVSAADSTQLGTIVVSAYDAGGNFVGASSTTQQVFAQASGATLLGPTLSFLTAGLANFAGLALQRPVVGTATVIFGASGLTPAVLTVSVSVGVPSALVITSAASLSFPAAAVTTVTPAIEFGVVDPAGNPLGAADTIARPLVPLLLNAQGNTSLFGVLSASTAAGAASWAGLAFLTPLTGSYRVQFLADQLQAVILDISITVGTAVRLVISTSAISLPSLPSVTLPTVTLHTEDGGGNRVGVADAVSRTISVFDQAAVVAVSSSPIVTVSGLAVASDLLLARPPSGLTTLEFATPGLVSATLAVTITLGPADSLQLLSGSVALPVSVVSLATTALPTLQLRSVDAAGVPLLDADLEVRSIQVTRTSLASLSYVGLDSRVMIDGQLSYSSAQLLAPVVGAHQFVFSSPGLTPLVLDIVVAVGPPSMLRITSPASLSVPVDFVSVIPSFTVVVADAGGNALPPASAITRTINVVAPLLTFSNFAQTITSSPAVVSGVTASSPTLGNYLLQCESPGLTAASIPLQVVVGSPSRLSVEIDSGNLVSAPQLLLPQFNVYVDDVLGNPLLSADSSSRNITVSSTTLSLNGTRSVVSSAGVATFSNVILVAPLAGSYQLSVSTPGLGSGTFTVVVIPGDLSGLRVIVQPPAIHSGGLLQIAPVVWTVDSVGNFVTSNGRTVDALVQAVPGGCLIAEGCALGVSATNTTVDGVATFSSISFTGSPGSLYQIVFQVHLLSSATTDPIQMTPCASIRANTAPTASSCVCNVGYTLDATLGECTPCPINSYKDRISDERCTLCNSDRFTAYYDGRTSRDDCVCAPGFYSRTFPSAVCTTCPTGGVCPGNTSVEAAVGYWQSPDTSSVRFFECVERDTQVCLGGKDSACLEGYSGPICDVCGPGYAGFGNTCDKCPPDGLSVFLLLLLLSLLIGVVVFLVRTALGPQSDVAVVAKIMIHYIQQIAFLSAVSTVWPSPFLYLFNAYAIATLSARFLPVACLFRFRIFTYLLWYITLPVFALAIAGIIYLIITRLMDAKTAKAMRQTRNNYYLVTFLVICFLTHTAVSLQVFQMFKCVKIGNVDYIAADKSELCHSPTHDAWIGISAVVLVFYVIAFPLGGIAFLFRNRYLLRSDSISSRFRFFYDGYDHKYFFWEFVTMLRKLALVLILVLCQADVSLQIFLVVILYVAAIGVHLYFAPLDNAIHMRLELLSLLMVYMTAILSPLYSVSDFTQPTLDFMTAVLIILHLLMLALFASVFAYMLLPEQSRLKIDRQLDRLREFQEVH
eukprot:TRINITY_DN1691_c0_g1_i2.p1 TRINITY_DN1691_c0_g1~~TRINITY_DN1691_c0_g1_i2.p1  ORF type:complete len:2795 (+),score=622.70 TRINITY_DN1691_c0_g1_i2:735-8387(+)